MRSFLFAFSLALGSLSMGQPQIYLDEFVTDPTNTDCLHPHFVEYSIDYHYTDLDAGCCLWFAFRCCRPWLGALQIRTAPGATVRWFYSTDYPACSTHSDCSTPPLATSDSAGTLWSVQPLLFTSPGYYYIAYEAPPGDCEAGDIQFDLARTVSCPPPCEGCTPHFSPEPGERYIVNAWAHEELPAGSPDITFTLPQLSIRSLDVNGGVIQTDPAGLTGNIIDGWQRMEGIIDIPTNAARLEIEFGTGPGNDEVLYDDIRLFPADGSMKCYVYDPTNLRFVAELDERHYATFYEYDAEGRLVRVKKETERGIMTIQENRQSAPVQPQ
ncbi:MAG: hypothetical protein KA175_01320 [Flavobacteriales bacterium]|nr:hypothetical protein [Flavobacteriales bacterium]MBP6696225.1 hypothetical protein [Flavobacteriales bacterium]